MRDLELQHRATRVGEFWPKKKLKYEAKPASEASYARQILGSEYGLDKLKVEAEMCEDGRYR